MSRRLWQLCLARTVLVGLVLVPAAVFAADQPQEWKLVNPEGVVLVEPVKVNPHPTNLEGKTIVLFWNGKHNGDLFLSRVGELLLDQVPGVKVVKVWEEHPETVGISGSVPKSQSKAKIVAGYKPDLVISSQCD